MYTLTYVLNGEVRQKSFDNKTEANEAFRVLNRHKLPIWASQNIARGTTIDTVFSEYNVPNDFHEEDSETLYSKKVYDDCINEVEDNFRKIKGAEYTYSKTLKVWVLYFYGYGESDGLCAIVGEHKFAII